MNDLGNFHLIRPAWVVLVPAVAFVWWLVRKSNDPFQSWRDVVHPELLNAMTVGQNENGSWRGAGLLVAWLLAAFTVAGPTWRPEPSPFADDPVPVMLLLKAGDTMDLSDMTPSRMERARLKIVDFARERRGQPLGLIAYAGTPHLVLPPTRDTSVVSTMAAEISPAMMPQPGDDLASALGLAAGILGDAGGSIVVVADTVTGGDETRLAEFRTNNRVPVHFLAVARADTPEEDAVKAAAAPLDATVTLMAPGSDDVVQLVRRTATSPVAVTAAGEGTRWAEAGWWLVPIIAAFVLLGFRRDEVRPSEVTE
jgi:Ca-activated chloride channel family protein